MKFDDYAKYKWFFTSNGKLVVGGKSAEQNDELLARVKKSGEDFIVMHTSEPGSPFSVIIEEPKKVGKEDMKEAAIFTGCFSRAWRAGKRKAIVDIFKASQVYKMKGMKTGTWGVRGNIEHKDVELKLVLTKQKKVLRAVPEESVKKKDILLRVCPGKIDKSQMLPKFVLELKDNITSGELLAALPAGGVSIIK